MAERRMFAKTIIDSDAFLDMPLSTQCLYFHLNMRADDEGFINSPKKIMRMIGASDDDLKVLITKKFIIPFESGVVVIKHWKIHNYIRKDRLVETVYQEEKKQLFEKENGSYSFNKSEILELDSMEETPRQKAYKESSLPYSFSYKIKNAFLGKKCPICGCTFSYENNLVKPTIQHNVPISKGGLHELGNISVICSSCNSSVRDTETGELNAMEVIEEWDKIVCQTNDRQMSDECQHRLGKVSIDKDNKEKINKKEKRKTYDDVFSEFSFSEELIKALKDFIDMRKTIKKPMTTRALELLIKNLEKLTNLEDEKIAILNQSIEHCWQTVYPLKDEEERKKYAKIKQEMKQEKLNEVSFDTSILTKEEYNKLLRKEMSKEELKQIAKERTGEKNVL